MYLLLHPLCPMHVCPMLALVILGAFTLTSLFNVIGPPSVLLTCEEPAYERCAIHLAK